MECDRNRLEITETFSSDPEWILWILPKTALSFYGPYKIPRRTPYSETDLEMNYSTNRGFVRKKQLLKGKQILDLIW